MPSSTRQATPGSSRVILEPLNAKKRGLSEEKDVVARDAKKLKEEHDRPEVKDKKKRKKKKRKMPVVAENDARSRSKPASSASATVVVLARASSSGTNIKPISGNAKTANHLFHMNVDAPGGDVLTPSDLAGASERQVSVIPGKVKASHPMPPDGEQEASSSSESAEDKIMRLTQELQVKDELVKRHETVLTQVQQTITCQICLDPMYKPYALAPCGHLACYDCLVQWFTTPPPDGQIAPVSNYLRKKTCPHCRAEIKQRPVEVWGVKSIVNGLIKSGLLLGLHRPDPSEINPDENGTPLDPWDGIFRKPMNQNPFAGPIPPPQNGMGVHDMGMYDAEDGGIYRCLECMHEIWDGVCSGCRRIYPGHERANAVDLDEVLDILEQGDDDDDDVDVDDDGEDDGGYGHVLGWYQGTFHAPHGHFHGYGYLPGQYMMGGEEGGVARLDEVESGDDESEEEEEYESSFIDDDIGERERRRSRRRLAEVINTDSDSDDEPPPVPRTRRGRADRNRINVSDNDDADDDGGRASSHGRRRVAGSDFSETDDEDGERTRPLEISQAHIVRIPRRRTAIVFSDEEVDSDSDERGYFSQISRRQPHTETPRVSDPAGEDSDLSSESERQFNLIDQERNMYGEDDSIPGPPAHLRHLFNQADDKVDDSAGEERTHESNSESEDETGYTDDTLDRNPWLVFSDPEDDSDDDIDQF